MLTFERTIKHNENNDNDNDKSIITKWVYNDNNESIITKQAYNDNDKSIWMAYSKGRKLDE